MNIIKIIFSLSLLMMMISSSIGQGQGQYLRMDVFGDDQCSRETVYSTKWTKLNFCNGQFVYRYVPNLGDGSSTTTTGNPLTTAGTLSSVDITSIVTQAVTLGMSGAGGLTNSGLLSIGALNVDNLVDAAASQSDNQNSGTTSQSPLPTSDPISSATTTTTITNNPTTTSSSILTNSGLLTIGGTTVSAVTDFVTSLISSSLTNIVTTGNGGATTSVQGAMGNVVLYYCLSASGCLTQCVSLQSSPVGICTKNKLDNVVYSVVNGTDMIVKIDNTTNPGPNNGYCQSFTSPSACVTDNNELTQYMNNQCGKGIKINCTSSVYNSYSCVDSSCLQCSKISSYPLNQCNLINSTSGVMFKSLLKTPITEEPTPLPYSSSSSTNDTDSSQQSSNSNNSFYNNNNNNNMITIIIFSIFFIISMI
ncbi:hypothetical protein DDB_G0286741 [Dictyostelium discoideum AX4]|uniref:Uncharacterized protein n=1 Tax=Dictyostelium discoideum TaxID=44689 RepID=Q54LA9_DICDI|nr:hypothetical protein DDB_G0286741 [Dictyostelium discoideum AX4]EAL64126.1 hypothetical protein DDB_G0286741 [Dictyostelium discoideum AX4]|eukprot:XP_637652.1 hypothetical protein DDB_G0286741 [Dictyostelium discoideum AX4]